MSYVPARKPFVRTPFNYDRDAVSEASGLSCVEPTMAQQQFKEECDINTILTRFGVSGQVPVSVRLPQYGDFTTVGDFQTAMQAVRNAEEAFMELPARVRERFGHDPQQLLVFVSDPSNLEEARKLGLAPSAPIPEPAPAATPPVAS